MTTDKKQNLVIIFLSAIFLVLIFISE